MYRELRIALETNSRLNLNFLRLSILELNRTDGRKKFNAYYLWGEENLRVDQGVLRSSSLEAL